MSGQATLFAAQTALVENPPPPEPANTDHAPATGGTDLVCFSHLRWNFVYQRPQHLLSRFARAGTRVFFVEEPVFGDEAEPRLESHSVEGGVTVVVPRLPHGLDAAAQVEAQRALVDRLFREQGIERPVLWYYTPMALAFSDHLEGAPVVYDCMDELSAFARRPARPPRARARAVPPRRRRVHRRPEPLRGQAGAARERPRLPEQRRRRPLRAGPRAAARAGRPGRDPAPADRLLRGDRRAARRGPRWPRSPTPAPTGTSCWSGRW